MGVDLTTDALEGEMVHCTSETIDDTPELEDYLHLVEASLDQGHTLVDLVLLADRARELCEFLRSEGYE